MSRCYQRLLLIGALLSAFSFGPVLAVAESIIINKRTRQTTEHGTSRITLQQEEWKAEETAIIVCDMWDSHHCLNAVRRVMELAPRMNQVLETAREKGVLIIHAPSSCMEAYRDAPGRRIAQSAPTAKNLPIDIGKWCYQIPSEEKAIYPIDQQNGSEDDDADEHRRWVEKLIAMGRNPKTPWKAQIAALRISDQDPISDSGVEIWNLLEDRHIRNVILVGVHTNMCVLGRPFGLRQLAKNGKNVVLMRDMTDTMYDPSKAPYVNHFGGTELIIAHIEAHVCPTILSTDLVGGAAFRFQQDRRQIVMIIGDDEYKTEETLPIFSQQELEPLGFEVTFIHADSQDKNHFPGLVEAVAKADLLLVSARRRTPRKEQLDAIREHLAKGKPVVGIRTASHAFTLRTESDNEKERSRGLDAWKNFDPEILGGNYHGHHPDGPSTDIELVSDHSEHPILRGVDVSQLIGHGSLYKVSPLESTTTPLLMGKIPNQPTEPIAWTNQPQGGRGRIFYTSLGHPVDFGNKHFRKLLLNGLLWTIAPDYVGQPPLD